MASGGGSKGLQSPGSVVRRLRNQTRRAAQDLAAIAEAGALAEDAHAAYALAAGEELDFDELLAFVLRARAEHPDQQLVIAVTARETTQPPTNNGGPHQAQRGPEKGPTP